MALAIGLVVAAIAGIVYGWRNRRRSLWITSVVVLILVLAIWTYFYFNPY